jgi:hypothetical protein
VASILRNPTRGSYIGIQELLRERRYQRAKLKRQSIAVVLLSVSGLCLLKMRNIGIIGNDMWHESIKDQQPDHPDSLIKQIRAKRVDVSKMNSNELDKHMREESDLRRQLSRSRGLPDILPAPEDSLIGKTPVATRDTTNVAKGHL